MDDDEKIEHDFKKIANQSGILEKQNSIPNICQLLPSSLDIAEITDKTKDDKAQINRILKEAGQPLLSSPTIENTDTDPFTQLWELHMYSLDMIYTLQEQMFEYKNKTHEQLIEIQKRITHNELTQSSFQQKIVKLLQNGTEV